MDSLESTPTVPTGLTTLRVRSLAVYRPGLRLQAVAVTGTYDGFMADFRLPRCPQNLIGGPLTLHYALAFAASALLRAPRKIPIIQASVASMVSVSPSAWVCKRHQMGGEHDIFISYQVCLPSPARPRNAPIEARSIRKYSKRGKGWGWGRASLSRTMPRAPQRIGVRAYA